MENNPDIYDERVYNIVVREMKELKYFFGNLHEVLKKLVMEHYLPDEDLDPKHVEHDIEWALADALGDGCEIDR